VSRTGKAIQPDRSPCDYVDAFESIARRMRASAECQAKNPKSPARDLRFCLYPV